MTLITDSVWPGKYKTILICHSSTSIVLLCVTLPTSYLTCCSNISTQLSLGTMPEDDTLSLALVHSGYPLLPQWRPQVSPAPQHHSHRIHMAPLLPTVKPSVIRRGFSTHKGLCFQLTFSNRVLQKISKELWVTSTGTSKGAPTSEPSSLLN